eukprot:gb/GEZN01004524.1/.p1 GENE.gb/GEZN01004524.1/~~gb/GEZN01004524.1/.p1  ORF type:complete len:471 (+),score=49.57 gb/GEZN01004524.1/:41-1453(+)
MSEPVSKKPKTVPIAAANAEDRPVLSAMADKASPSVLKSWLGVPENSPFPIQNLPYGVFRPTPQAQPRIGVAIGQHVVDLQSLVKQGMFSSAKILDPSVLAEKTLNSFMATGRPAWQEARAILISLLVSTNSNEAQKKIVTAALVPMAKCKMELPARIGDYTDFFSSKNHATNLGCLFRHNDPAKALLPNYLHLPVGYHGRASSIVVSGTDIRRPWGQKTPQQEGAAPQFEPCSNLDFELEVAFFVGPGSQMGKPLTMANAADHIFGLVLMNDWSARDIQKWEYVPLGPFTAKNFGTTISPWVVTMEALAPFRKPVLEAFDPDPQAYLQTKDGKHFSYDVKLEVQLRPKEEKKAFVISKGNVNGLYWTFEQQLVHHTITGCNMCPGDLCGSGTISGTQPEARGSMIEISWAGQKPLSLPNGSTRKFLEDGDEVNLLGYAQGDGYMIGFGDCCGRILPALSRNDLMGHSSL